METAEARADAERRLKPLGRRWTHVQAVAAVAVDIAHGLGISDQDVLVAAAWLHDIGYCPDLAHEHFHPFDGARYVRSLGEERLAGLIAYHSGSRYTARLRGLEEALAAFHDEASDVSAALTFADMTTGPAGEQMTLDERLAELEARYGEDHDVPRSLQIGFGELRTQVERGEALLKRSPVSSDAPGSG